MILFDASERLEFLATQSLHYDRYSCCTYFPERVRVDGKCGLACGEEVDGGGCHETMVLEPVYSEIQVRKISGPQARYDKYAVFADGDRIGQFTLVLNAWVPQN